MTADTHTRTDPAGPSALADRVAIITGAASGIGAASARRFAAAGARLVLADIQDARGEALARELDAGGLRVVYRHADVADAGDVQALVDFATARFGRLDALFNNAGYPGAGGAIADVPVDGFDRTVAVLLRSVFLGMKYAAPVMCAQGAGSIVSTASVAGLQAGFAGHAYSAAKAGVIHLTRSVAMELGERGVRVNCICPGAIATPIFGKALGLADDAASERRGVVTMKAVLAAGQPIRRAGLPEDIADAALWLCSDAAGFVNGHALTVDGGLTGGRGWSQVLEGRQAVRKALGLD